MHDGKLEPHPTERTEWNIHVTLKQSVAFIIDTHLVCCQHPLFFWQRPLFNLANFIWEEVYLEDVLFVFLQSSLNQPEKIIIKRQAKEFEQNGFTFLFQPVRDKVLTYI